MESIYLDEYNITENIWHYLGFRLVNKPESHSFPPYPDGHAQVKNLSVGLHTPPF